MFAEGDDAAVRLLVQEGGGTTDHVLPDNARGAFSVDKEDTFRYLYVVKSVPLKDLKANLASGSRAVEKRAEICDVLALTRDLRGH